MAGGFAGFGYSFVMTFVLVALMQIISIWIPSLGLRANTRGNEQVRLDLNELGDTEAVRSAPFRVLQKFLSYLLQYRINCRYHRIRDSRERVRTDSTEEENGVELATINGHASGGV